MMRCPRCGSESRVADSRPKFRGSVTRRRRFCVECRHRWSTLEYEAFGEFDDLIVFDEMLTALDARDLALLKRLVQSMLELPPHGERRDEQQGNGKDEIRPHYSCP